MTIEQAVEKAEKYTEGLTFHISSDGPTAVMAVLLAEVKRKPFDMRADKEKRGPLPALLLADTADQIADELADIAKEIDIYNGLRYDSAIKEIGTFKVALVLFAKQLREDSATNKIEVRWEENQR